MGGRSEGRGKKWDPMVYQISAPINSVVLTHIKAGSQTDPKDSH